MYMKIKSSVAAFCLLSLLLSGCGLLEGEREEEPRRSDPPAGDVDRTGPEGPETPGEEPESPAPSPLSALTAGTDSGYYIMTSGAGELTDGRQGRHLLYIDYAARRQVYLCADPACSHNGPDCTSVFPTDEFKPGSALFTMGGRVYLLSKSPDMDGSTALGLGGGSAAVESDPAELYVMDAGGTGRERLFTFGDDLTVEDFAAGDGDGLYFITKKVSTREGGGSTFFTSTERKLVRLDLGARELSPARDMDLGGGVDWDPIGCYGRELILTGIDFGRELDPQEKGDKSLYDNAADVFAALDVDTGELREIYRAEHPESRSWVLEGDTLYYASDGGGVITGISLADGTVRTVCETVHDRLWGAVGGRLYTWEQDEGAFYFIDPAGGEISRGRLLDRTTGFHIQIVAEAGDRVLVIYDTDASPKSDGSFDVRGYYYALISQSDLFAGTANYEPIEMAEVGI